MMTKPENLTELGNTIEHMIMVVDQWLEQQQCKVGLLSTQT